MEIDHIDRNHHNDLLSNLMLLHLHCHDERHSKLTKTILKSSPSKQPKRIAEGVVPEGYAQEQGDAEMTVMKERIRQLEQEGISLK